MQADDDPNCVHMLGGLGNQLFQYLFGQELEGRTGRRTVYDLSNFSTYRLHDGFVLEADVRGSASADDS